MTLGGCKSIRISYATMLGERSETQRVDNVRMKVLNYKGGVGVVAARTN